MGWTIGAPQQTFSRKGPHYGLETQRTEDEPLRRPGEHGLMSFKAIEDEVLCDLTISRVFLEFLEPLVYVEGKEGIGLQRGGLLGVMLTEARPLIGQMVRVNG
jgi:hypothetical protein